MPTTLQLSLLALAWLAYFIFHSTLASLGLKNLVALRWPRFMPAYRLTFNLLAVLLLLGPLWLVHEFQGAPLWQWQGVAGRVATALRITAIAGFLWSLRYYDGAEFTGIRQFQNHEQSVEDQEHFHISPLHRYVRHPWYFLGLVILWSGNMEPAWLLSVIMMSLYFIIGSRLEERKLLHYHGEVYRRYLQAVPGLLPSPWRYLSRTEQQQLLKQYSRH